MPREQGDQRAAGQATARAMAGETLAEIGLLAEPELDGFFVKEAVAVEEVHRHRRAPLGPEMRSTARSWGTCRPSATPLPRASFGAGTGPPLVGGVLITVNDYDKAGAQTGARSASHGFCAYATEGTGAFRAAGMPATILEKGSGGVPGYSTLTPCAHGRCSSSSIRHWARTGARTASRFAGWLRMRDSADYDLGGDGGGQRYPCAAPEGVARSYAGALRAEQGIS